MTYLKSHTFDMATKFNLMRILIVADVNAHEPMNGCRETLEFDSLVIEKEVQ